jgi:ribonuclease HI
MIKIATDGGCYPNPGPGGWAWVDQDGNYEAGAFVAGTNNVAELTALKHALLAHPDQPIHVQYDSQYAVNCVTLWGPNWRRKGLTGKANIELIFEIMDIIDARPRPVAITWEWVPGHDPSNAFPLNTAVDALATRMTRLRREHHETGVVQIDWEPRTTRSPGVKK